MSLSHCIPPHEFARKLNARENLVFYSIHLVIVVSDNVCHGINWESNLHSC